MDRNFGAQITAGQTCAPGVLMYMTSAGTISVADHSDSHWAHGVALTSGAGTKVAGISQFVTLLRHCRVYDVGVTLTVGGDVYLGENGGYATSGTQKVGFALAADEVFVDLDVQLGS